MTRPPPRYFFLGRPFRCRRLTSDLHSWVQGAQALSHFTLPLHLSPHSQPPLRYVLSPFLCHLSRTALTGLLQTRVILQSEILFLLCVFSFSMSATSSQICGGTSLSVGFEADAAASQLCDLSQGIIPLSVSVWSSENVGTPISTKHSCCEAQ